MLETKRTRIRPIKITDNKQLFAYRSDAEANKYQGWIPKNMEEVDEFIAKNPTQINKAETWFQLVIIDKDSDDIIGDIGLHFVDKENLQMELGCTIRKEDHGKGFATEVMRTTINFLFKELKKHRIITSIDPRNTNSLKLVERLGFRKEGHFKESLLIDGKWEDDVIYAILNKEWKSI